MTTTTERTPELELGPFDVMREIAGVLGELSRQVTPSVLVIRECESELRRNINRACNAYEDLLSIAKTVAANIDAGKPIYGSTNMAEGWCLGPAVKSALAKARSE